MPVFMLMVFFIMEMGHLAFQTIVIHHAAYEMARIGSLVAGPKPDAQSSGINLTQAKAKMCSVLCNMFKPGVCQPMCRSLKVVAEDTTFDRQAERWNQDLILTVKYPVRLIFPGTGLLLASDPDLGSVKKSIDSNVRVITVQVRMPIEKPFIK
ncbi:MAG: pilus assembly protein [Elusimicrobia bacterium]|nr:pilus assembly protein [Elusimicrobiota bacterium]